MEPGKSTTAAGFLQALFNGRNKVARNGAADDFVDEFKVATGKRFEANPDVTILTATTGLFLVFALDS